MIDLSNEDLYEIIIRSLNRVNDLLVGHGERVAYGVMGAFQRKKSVSLFGQCCFMISEISVKRIRGIWYSWKTIRIIRMQSMVLCFSRPFSRFRNMRRLFATIIPPMRKLRMPALSRS